MHYTAIAQRLADMAEREQDKAQLFDIRASAEGITAGQQALLLGDRDKHIARAGAFLEAARLALKGA